MGGALSEPFCKTVGAKVGTCGFGVSRAEYARTFLCVEIQHTFYQPPQLKTLERWRQQMPEDFEFTVKAWQLITHDAKSPTYRRLKRKLSEAEKKEAGYFQPSAIVREAWDATLAAAKALEAKTILFQCPASFNQTPENIASLEKFFGSIEREDLKLYWERVGIGIKRYCDQFAVGFVWGTWLIRLLIRRSLRARAIFDFTGAEAGAINMRPVSWKSWHRLFRVGKSRTYFLITAR